MSPRYNCEDVQGCIERLEGMREDTTLTGRRGEQRVEKEDIVRGREKRGVEVVGRLPEVWRDVYGD